MTEETTLYSIGELSARTGIAAHTLRVWERRHQRPVAVRLPSGHRRYPEDQLRWTQMVAELLAFGHKTGKLIPLSEAQLQELLDEERCRNAPNPELLDSLVEVGVRGNSRDFAAQLSAVIGEHGARQAIELVIAPLIQLVGQRWEEGSIGIRDEHLMSAIIHDVLRDARASLVHAGTAAGSAAETRLILATLPGERHGLGLEMVHLVAELGGVEVQQLGVDLPVEEIAAAAADDSRAAVGISVSRNSAGPATERAVAALRDSLPKKTELLVGGQGALITRRRVPGVEYFSKLAELESWIEQARDTA